MRAVALSLALAACATSPPIVVRMARPGDHLPPVPATEQLPNGRRIHHILCTPEGDRDDRLTGPILRFARTHLAEPGERVRIEPRSEVGWLRVSNAPNTWHHGTDYCAVVLRTPTSTTVVLRQDAVWMR